MRMSLALCALFVPLSVGAGLGCSDPVVFPDGGGGSGEGAGATGGSNTGGSNTGGSSTGGGNTGGSSTGGGNTGGSGGGGPVTCGDLICDPSECGTCMPDCGATCVPGGGCGDGTCDANEDCTSCPADCATGCGDGCCLINEDCQSCAQDCVTVESCDPSACGNGACNYALSETCLNCADCFGLCDCGDGTCAAPETAQNCPYDCSNG